LGDPGAVTPGVLVTVTNLNSGAHAESTARADGSVEVSVAGSLQDEYDVTVASDSNSQTVRIGADTGPEDAGASNSNLSQASCNALEATLGRLVVDGFGAASTRCESDSDCGYTTWNVGCYSQCGGSYLAASEVTKVQASVEQTIAPVCTEFAQRCSTEAAGACPPIPDPLEVECYQGSCRHLDAASLSCDALSTKAALRAREVKQRASLACATDADCAIVSLSVSCVQDCGSLASVAMSAVAAVQAEVDRAESYFCARFDSKACPPQQPLPCRAQTSVAHCQAGECAISDMPN
jgi:hypothetical protein